ncbi:MAG: hypothetical protein P4L87_13220 [Formivibrio sp.]|nr:hypothetical protein [Formivibrio sp.]
MDSDLFRQQYDFELEQRNSIAAATNIPIVAITVVASATSAVLLDYQYKSVFQSYVFLIFASFALIAIVVAISYLFCSFWNYEYQKLPNSTALKQHFEALFTWHSGEGLTQEDAKKFAVIDFEDYVNQRLAEAGDWNGQNNIIRGNYLHRATAAVAVAVVMLIPAGLIYAHNKATADDKIYQVRLVSTPSPIQLNAVQKEVKVSNQSSSSGNPTTIPAAPAPSSKPSGPPNTVFKGNTDLPKPGANSQSSKK